jgi:hypothetical protein
MMIGRILGCSIAIAAATLAVHAVRSVRADSIADQFIPRRPDSRPQTAQQLVKEGHFSEAAEILKDYIDDRPRDGDARVQLGWCYYRLGQFAAGKEQFAATLKMNPRSDDARVGLGYCTLQTDGGNAAAEWFRQVLAHDAMAKDALEGMVLAGRRGTVSKRVANEATEAARRLESLSKTFRPELLPAGSEKRLRDPVLVTQPLFVAGRAVKDFIEVNEDGVFKPIFINGFNLGVALPGHFAAEFPTDEALYTRWLETIAGMNANAVRLYTLLPPEFYRALKNYNATHPDGHLWLIQGVWTELPPKNDFSDPDYMREFNAETARVIDAVHGNLVLGPTPGHAFGVYNADASASVLAFIIGHEWEPFAVADYNRLRAGTTDFSGAWFQVKGARPMECWVAAACDFAAEHEAKNYAVVRPLTFANWPTLDPLPHPTESTRAEENVWRQKNGLPPLLSKVAVWEDDAETLDSTLILPTAQNPAGFFAAYNIYPNFPDFMNQEPAYDSARDAAGPNRYLGYLQALKAYHGAQPVLVTEFGMATSRAVAHIHPQQWNHGGVDERQQGILDARMLRNIYDARMAGGIVFAFVDEWFKGTWSVAPFESPADRRRMWFNAESPEQSYGIMAARPARVSIALDGRRGEWDKIPVLMSR